MITSSCPDYLIWQIFFPPTDWIHVIIKILDSNNPDYGCHFQLAFLYPLFHIITIIKSVWDKNVWARLNAIGCFMGSSYYILLNKCHLELFAYVKKQHHKVLISLNLKCSTFQWEIFRIYLQSQVFRYKTLND